MITQEQYKFDPTKESIPEYNARIAGLQKTTQWRGESEEEFKKRTTPDLGEVPNRIPRDVRDPGDVRADIAGIKAGGATEIKSEEDIRADQATRLQKRIDAVSLIAQQRIRKEEERGQIRLAQTRSMNVRGGLIGSSFAGAATERARDVTSKNVEAIQAEKQAAILDIQDRVDERTDRLVQMRREKAEGAIEEFQAEIDRMDKEARDDVGMIAKADVSLEDFKLSSDYESLKGQLEMSDLQLDSLFISQIPPENIISSQKVGGKMMFFIRKADGTITTEEIDLPEEAAGDDYSFTIAPDGTPILFNKTTGDAKIAEGYEKGQFAKPVKPKDPSAGDEERADTASMGSALAGQAGPKGYVSPEDYNFARQKWVTKSGRSSEDFDEFFGTFRDPAGEYNIYEF